MEVEGALQMGLTAVAGVVLLYTIARSSGQQAKETIKYESPPSTVVGKAKREHVSEPVLETPVRRLHEKTQNDDSTIVREMHLPADTPSWMSKREPSFVKEEEFLDEDLHPTWMSAQKEKARIEMNGNGHGHAQKPIEFEPSWLSNREPSFVGNPLESDEVRPSWMTSQTVPSVPASPKLAPATNGVSNGMSNGVSHSPLAPAQMKINQGFIETDGMELSWMSTKDVHYKEYEADFSWMTRKDPTPTLANILKIVPGRSHRDHRVVASLNDVVSHMARAHSDLVFVYPIATSGFLGECLKGEEKQNPKCLIQLVETRAGAGRVVVGSASGYKQRVSVLCSSRSLRPMIPAVIELAEKRLPVTFHVALSAMSEDDVSSKVDHSDLSAIRDVPDVVIVASAGPQDTYEMAVAAHWISHKLDLPVFHVFDSTGRLNRVSDVELSLRGKELTFARQAAESDVKVATKVLRSIRKEPFEYTGSPDARVVVIAMGAAAQVAERHVLSFADSAVAVGAVRVRLLRPWSAEDLLSSLPLSVLRVCVLDQSHSDALFADVAASFAADASRRHVQVSYVRVPPSFRGVSFDLVTRAFEELMLSSDERLILSAPISSLQKRERHTEARSAEHHSLCVFVSSKHAHGAFLAGRDAAKHLGRDIVRFASYTDDFAGESGGVSMMEVRFADGKSDANAMDGPLEAGQAQVVVVADNETLAASQVDLFGPLKEGGIVVLPTHAVLSLPMKRRASAKHARVVHLGESSGPEGWSAIVSGLAVLSREDWEHTLSHLLSAFRAAHHDSMDWNDLNEACRRLEHGAMQLMTNTVGAAMNGHSVHHSPRHNSSAHHANFPRRLGDLFQSENSSLANTNGMDASQNGMSDFSTSSFPMTDTTVFGLIPRVAFAKHTRNGKDAEAESNLASLEMVRPHEIAWNVVFKDAYETGSALRPREHDTYKVRLVCRKRLTPLSYDRNIFHLEFDISGTDLKYEIGDALGVFGHNHAEEVDDFIRQYNATGGKIDSDAFIAFKNTETHAGKAELVSVRNLFLQHLDLFGRPSKKFYVWLSNFATSRYEKLKLHHTGTDDAEGFKLGVNETLTFADILLQHPSARPSVEDLASIIPAIKARHYSIASSMRYTPRSVSLLIVAVDWTTPMGRKRYGQCTRYLAELDPDVENGCFVTVDVVPSVLRLPPRPEQPIVMAGLGTGMAPFRAFVQERKVQKESGLKVGPIVLYFGARHRSEEWLYGEEWDQYFKEGLVTRLGLAFSRDQKEKIYIQHRIKEDAALLEELFLHQEGYFYLCGPTWPVPDVRDAMAMGLDPENAKQGNTEIVERLKEEGRYILEVY